MRKGILIVMALLLMVPSAFAASADAKAYLLDDASGTAMSTYALTSGVAVYSQTVYVRDNIGFATILVTENKAGGAGDVDISAQYSLDGTNWHTAYTTDMSGTITAEGNVVTALQNVTRWIPFTVRMAPYMRLKFDPDADSQITAYIIYQRDR